MSEISLRPGTDNIFHLPSPEILVCQVEGLSGDYPALWFRVYSGDGKQVTHLVFRGTMFFSGPTL